MHPNIYDQVDTKSNMTCQRQRYKVKIVGNDVFYKLIQEDINDIR